MTEDLAQLLANLRLSRIASIIDDEIELAEKEQISYQELIARLLRAQWNHVHSKALESRIRRARFPETWTLESFPFKKQPGVKRRQIYGLANLDFIAKAENLVLVGPTGVGKTGIASGLLLKALENGYRGRFIRAQDLLDEMYASLADRSTRKLLNHLARLDVILIDELGYLNVRPEQANVFFKLMEERYQNKSTIITTNLAYDEWETFLGNPAMTKPLLSRLRHRCHTIQIDGPSLREPTG